MGWDYKYVVELEEGAPETAAGITDTPTKCPTNTNIAVRPRELGQTAQTRARQGWDVLLLCEVSWMEITLWLWRAHLCLLAKKIFPGFWDAAASWLDMQGSWRGGQVQQARISTWKKANTLVKWGWMGVWAGLDARSSLHRITDYLARFQTHYPSRESSLPSCTHMVRVVGFQSRPNSARTRLVRVVLVSRVGGGVSMSPSADGKAARGRQGPTKAGSA